MDLEELEVLLEDDAPLFRYVGYYYLYEYHLDNPPELAKVKEAIALLEPDLPKAIVKQFQKGLRELDFEYI